VLICAHSFFVDAVRNSIAQRFEYRTISTREHPFWFLSIAFLAGAAVVGDNVIDGISQALVPGDAPRGLIPMELDMKEWL
jgi:hypothetical protein